MTKSKRVLVLLCAITCVAAFTGCQEDKVPSGSYRVEIEDVFEMSDFILKKLTITTSGTKRLHIQLLPGNEDMATFSPDKGSKYAKATVLVVAEKVLIGNKTVGFLRYPITTREAKMSGCSGPIELLQSSDLSEEFELMLESGIFPIGQPMDFARIHDRTYKLLID